MDSHRKYYLCTVSEKGNWMTLVITVAKSVAGTWYISANDNRFYVDYNFTRFEGNSSAELAWDQLE